jgi:hypothetical protein
MPIFLGGSLNNSLSLFPSLWSPFAHSDAFRRCLIFCHQDLIDEFEGGGAEDEAFCRLMGIFFDWRVSRFAPIRCVGKFLHFSILFVLVRAVLPFCCRFADFS